MIFRLLTCSLGEEDAISAHQQSTFVFRAAMKRQDIPQDTTHLIIQSSAENTVGFTSTSTIPEDWLNLVTSLDENSGNTIALHLSGEWHRQRMNSSSQNLEECVFGYHANLEHVELYQGLLRIGPFAFIACSFLESVALPSTVVTIGQHAFARCSNMVDINLPEGLQVIDDRAFYDCHSLGHVAIPSTVAIVGKHAFQSCHSLVDIEFRKGLKEIQEYAFWKCKSLCAVSIPSPTHMVLGKCAFADCHRLLSVEFSADTTSLELGRSCFAACPSLVNLSIPSSTVIGSLAFIECPFKAKDFSDRFTNLPLHKACYHSSTLDVDGLNAIIRTAGWVRDECGASDTLGMTPFHLIATSASLQPDFLQILLEQYPVNILSHQDKRGKTMMDYLLINGSNKAISLIKMILERTVVTAISSWGLWEPWKLDLVTKVEESGSWDDDAPTRRKALDDILDRLVTCTRIEATSILEQTLWKMNNNRFACGADVVLPNVIGFLWNNHTPGPSSSPHEYAVLAPEVSWLQGHVESDDDWDDIW
ncbi:unnamed protein product [Cylindrotheca closterium]|uniref:Uncharacterized protein n=1 Tax=Cylindrotheca closterium TaxID=2856 RepID=A0AAD2CGQ8_9STRA|nr:unnamed protein product [Cylindrotheca closterium]